MKSLQRSVAGAVLIVLLAACGSSGSESSATDAPVTAAPATDPPATDPPATEAPTTAPPATAPPATEAPATTAAPTTVAPTTTIPVNAVVIGDADADGVIAVTVDGALLDPLFDSFIGGADPYHHVHTQQENVFVGVELYTEFGAAWTGETGTFPADCTTHGICIYLDPDGTGPTVGGGPATGTITITQLEGGSIITIDEALIVGDDGQEYRLTGTLVG